MGKTGFTIWAGWPTTTKREVSRMPEYIEREALIQDAEDVLTFQMLDRINRQPAADVAQVVRCKDCCYWNRKYTTVGECEKLADRDQEGGAQFDCDMDDTDFCSY